MITKGYHNNPEATKSSFTADGYLRTGDVLRVEGDLLYIVDRKKASNSTVTDVMKKTTKSDFQLDRSLLNTKGCKLRQPS